MVSDPTAHDLSPRRLLTSPCPLCRYVFNCPFDEHYRQECIDFWPLSRAKHRVLEANDPVSERLRERALAIAWVADIIDVWLGGGQVTDAQYLRLRREASREDSDDVAVHTYVLSQFLGAGVRRHTLDAASYYRLGPDFRSGFRSVFLKAMEGALTVVRDDMVEKDAGVPVVSHFERLFYDCYRFIFHAFSGAKELVLPHADNDFMNAIEDEWARALSFGNGYFGLTVVPLVSILDMVRYQQLGGRNRVISRSMVEQVILLMDTFPLPVQHVLPKFRDVALKERLLAMFHPLLGACATKAGRRLEYAGEELARVAYPRLFEEFRAVLAAAADRYSFMHGKAGTPEDAVGMLGFSASPQLRQDVAEICAEWGLDVDIAGLTHVNASYYLSECVVDHLREHYPVTRRRAVSLDQPVNDDEDTTLADLVAASEGADSAPVLEVTIAHTVAGVQYLYRDEIAGVACVSPDQLRRWDEEGTLKALRVRDLLPNTRSKIEAERRIYPYTNEMIETIRALARRKEHRVGHLPEGEYNRAQAAAVLPVTYRTLQRWEERGKAKPIWRDGAPIYTLEEIRRLAALAGGSIGSS